MEAGSGLLRRFSTSCGWFLVRSLKISSAWSLVRYEMLFTFGIAWIAALSAVTSVSTASSFTNTLTVTFDSKEVTIPLTTELIRKNVPTSSSAM